ncbi:MAG: DUF2207 domain-containing protein, partial [Chloroflexi bacterium]|nr:DUF2207 domain-containing protein [Chloroflexota bacterium]
KVNLALVLLGVIVLIAGGLWLWNVFRGRVRVPRSSFAPPMVYSPPDDLPPALVGLLTKNAVGANELVATIFDLAQKRVIAIAQAERKKFFFSSKDVMLSRSSGITKHSFERLVADALASENGTWLSEQRGRLPELLRDFSSRVEQESVRQGLFQEEPSKSKGRLSKPGLFMLFVTPFVGIPLVLWLFERAEMIFVPFVSVLLVGLATIILSSKMPSVTEVGATQAGLWKGFGRYLKKMVKDKSLAVDNVSYWDSYFPYAVIFGLSKGWVTTFEGLGANAPAWFHVGAADSGADLPVADWQRRYGLGRCKAGWIDRTRCWLPVGLGGYVPGDNQRWTGGCDIAFAEEEGGQGCYSLWSFSGSSCNNNITVGQ